MFQLEKEKKNWKLFYEDVVSFWIGRVDNGNNNKQKVKGFSAHEITSFPFWDGQDSFLGILEDDAIEICCSFFLSFQEFLICSRLSRSSQVWLTILDFAWRFVVLRFCVKRWAPVTLWKTWRPNGKIFRCSFGSWEGRKTVSVPTEEGRWCVPTIKCDGSSSYSFFLFYGDEEIKPSVEKTDRKRNCILFSSIVA